MYEIEGCLRWRDVFIRIGLLMEFGWSIDISVFSCFFPSFVENLKLLLLLIIIFVFVENRNIILL